MHFLMCNLVPLVSNTVVFIKPWIILAFPKAILALTSHVSKPYNY